MGFSLRSIAPWIGAAAATALPGPLGAAALAIGKAIGKPVDATPEAITDAAMAALGDPAQVAAIRAADNEFKLQWQNAGFKNDTDIMALAVDDRKDARNREIQVRDRTPQVGFYVLLAGFFVALIALMKIPVPAENKAMVFGMIGSLGTLAVMAATYYYGTTESSRHKTELLAQAPAIGSDQKLLSSAPLLLGNGG